MYNLTNKARDLLQSAAKEAANRVHKYLEPIHLLYAIIQIGIFNRLIKDNSIQINLRSHTETALNKIVIVRDQRDNNSISSSSSLLQVLDKAQKIARELEDSYVGQEALCLSLFVDNQVNNILHNSGLKYDALLSSIKQKRAGRTLNSESDETEINTNMLTKYTRDLTEAARQAKLDPVIGRDEEIRRTIQVLLRRTKNNPVLIGEPGVGKTAIAEGLAQRIIARDVPDRLQDKKVLTLDLGLLLAGAKFRGEFEERLKNVLQKIIEAAGEIIVFIDELHTLVGAGAGDGAMDASNLMKPALARGELHCIGATTLVEHKKYIEKDAALARRFQTILIEEPTIEQAISILRGLKEKYELHHGVRISDSAIIAAVRLSARYISGRFLPDKAIDVVDEAASRLRMAVDSKPEEIDTIDRRIIELKIEREAIRKEQDEISRQRLPQLEQELQLLEANSARLTACWETERNKLANATELKEKLEQARQELLQAQREGIFERAGELAYSTIPRLEAELHDADQRDINNHSGLMLSETIFADDIATVITRWTGVPADRILISEQKRLLNMETELACRVIGQEQAVKAVSQVIRRSRAGLQDDSRPLGSFLFLGPTGVGKTELTKALASFLFSDDTAILRFDMSEYMERHAVARLIGAPPGYIGYDDGGTLTEIVRRKPYQVILFDEIEKAHPDIFNVLLQVLDDGRMTDGKGTTVDFRHSVIILTSNLGTEHFTIEDADDQGKPSVLARDAIMDIVRTTFRPEFLNRLDEIMIFNRLVPEKMEAIVNIEIEKLAVRMNERGYNFEVTNKARKYLSQIGFDARYGARPLKRTVIRHITNPLAEHILSGTWPEQGIIKVDKDNISEEKQALSITLKH